MTDDSLCRVTQTRPTFDLVVATLGRAAELDAFLWSLERQTYRSFRLVVVDQNEDDRVADTLTRHPDVNALRLRSLPGLSRARNVALPHLEADVVAFPDDDGLYPDRLLENVASLLAARPELDGITGRAADPRGVPWGRWPTVSCPVELDTVWNRANSLTVFLRRRLLERVGGFDEALGLGSGTPWHSGEEIELLVRALRCGARIEYDPSLVALHDAAGPTPAALRALGRRDGASVGYILARHRYPARAVARMLVRPAGGTLVWLLRRDPALARYQLATLRGRLTGYRAGRRAGVIDLER